MLRVPKEVLYFDISARNPVTHRVALGEWFEVQTQMNAGPWIEQLPQAEAQRWREKLTGGNPSSGCLLVEGVRAGDVLGVEIGEIALDPLGYTQFSGNNGAMPGLLEVGPQQRIVIIGNNVIHWSNKLQLPARPMLGFVGVAPRGDESYHHGWGGYWGGNMDAQEVTTGTTLHLRANHDGALLHIGDMHAIQGDGEICGAGGIEAEGVVRIRCTQLPASATQQLVRFHDATHVGAVACAVPAEDAFRLALCELLRYLQEEHGMAYGEAYLLLAQVMEARCTQFVNPSFTYVVKVNRKYLV